jgi:hypothetical protein
LLKNDEGLSGEAKLLSFLRDATSVERKIWLSRLSVEERQTVHQLLRRVEENPWTQWLTDPIGFVELGLKETLWSKQREILMSVRDNKRTAVPACHAPGKKSFGGENRCLVGDVPTRRHRSSSHYSHIVQTGTQHLVVTHKKNFMRHTT